MTMQPFFSLLTICGIPELEAHGARGVTHILSILDPDIADPDFGRYPAQSRTVLRFDDIVEPEPGKQMPRREDVAAVLAFGRAIADGTPAEGHLLVHCHAGISRSTAAMAMILAQAHPEEAETAIVEKLVAIRPQAWPNLIMIQFADDMLDRGGRLIAAVGGLYRRRLAERPELAEGLVRLGRSAELALAREGGAAAA